MIKFENLPPLLLYFLRKYLKTYWHFFLLWLILDFIVLSSIIILLIILLLKWLFTPIYLKIILPIIKILLIKILEFSKIVLIIGFVIFLILAMYYRYDTVKMVFFNIFDNLI